MKRILLLCLFLGVVCVANSQTITIKDKETQKPLELVALISDNPKTFATTNGEGQADIKTFKGSALVQILSLGYKTVVKSYTELESMGFEVFLEASNINLDELVVSGTRWRQLSHNVPTKIVSISSKEVALQNSQTAADLLGISGKVYVQKSQQGGGSPIIRGFATNRLLYTVDGVRMNTAIFRGGNIQNVINLDPFATENTEVFFGPGSVIYGSDAIGGAMAFQTLTPKLSITDKPMVTGKVVTRYSTANKEKTGHFDVNIGWKKLALITSYSAWDFDHLRQGSNGPKEYLKPYYVQRQDSVDKIIFQDDPLLQIPSAYSQMNLMQKILFAPNEKWDLQYGFHYSETSPYGRYDRHNRVRNGVPRYAEWNYGKQKWMMNNLNITHYGDNIMYDMLSARVAMQSFEESRIDRSFNNDERNTQEEEVQAYSANLDMTKATGVKNTLFYGLEYVFNDVESRGLITNISAGSKFKGPSRYPESTWTSIGAYINDELKITEKIIAQAGIRYNVFNLAADFTDNLEFYPFPFSTASINKGSLTGSIGGVYRPTNNLVISSNFGTAFRSPNVDDVGKIFDSEPGTVTVPNPNLKEEYAYNLDFSMAKVFGELVKIDATCFYTLLQNALVRRDFSIDGNDSIMYDGEMSKVQAIQNAAKASVYGVQVGLEVKLPVGLSFSSDINYQVGKEELDDKTTSASRHAVPLFGLSRLNYKYDNLSLQVYSAYQVERKYEDLAVDEQMKDEIYAKDSEGKNYSPAWYTLNIKVIYDLTDVFAISSGIENLTDQRYRSYSSGISSAGRNFILSLSASF